MKDNFSSNADKYARFRPTYPADIFAYLSSIVENRETAWDCGTGNGQVAFGLANYFDYVFATDISRSQLDNALIADNLFYSVQPAEKTNFKDQSFDLIVVAQAIHWFDFDLFYAEVRRTAKEGAMICILGYDRIKISVDIDAIITNFYEEIIGTYWDAERRFIDEKYETIPFPFDEIQAPDFENKHQWNLQHLMGYLSTWSAVKHFVKHNGYNPIDQLEVELKQYWRNGELKEVVFPTLLRIGSVTGKRKQGYQMMTF